MTDFEKLQDALDLFKHGRKNAAKSQWNDLPEVFRKTVMKFALLTSEQPEEELNDYNDLVLIGKSGKFQMTKENLLDVVNLVPELALS